MKKVISISFAIILLITIILFVIVNQQRNNFLPTETIQIENRNIINDFPVSKEDMQLYLESQYVENEDSAGFSLVINDPDNYRNFNFAFYIFSLAKQFNTEFDKDLLKKYRKHFESYNFDFNQLTLDEMYRIAVISVAIDSNKFIDEIKDKLKNLYSAEHKLYTYTSNEDSGSFSYISSFGATLIVSEIYSELNIDDENEEIIRNSISENIGNYLTELSKCGEKDNYYNLLLLAKLFNFNISYLDIDFREWLVKCNQTLTESRDYSFETAYLVYEISEINNYLSFSQSNIKDYIQSADYYFQTKHIGFNDINATIDLCLIKTTNIVGIPIRPNNDVTEYLNECIETNFIKRDQITPKPIYTYYGVVLSKYFDFSLSFTKVSNTIKLDFLPNILNDQNAKNQNYILDSYFTVLLIKELELDVSSSNKDEIKNNINNLLNNLDLWDLNIVYQNLYTIQFSFEISKMINFTIESETTGKIKNYLSYLVNNDICNGSFQLSEIKIIYNILGVTSDKLEQQFSDTVSSLNMNGGFSPISGEKISDIIITAKMYRITKCDNLDGLSTFLSQFIVNGYIVPNDDITQTDLRVYYNYFKLWLITKGENEYAMFA